MNTEMHAAALIYAMSLVEYYKAKKDDSIDADTLVRQAYNHLCDSQAELNALAEVAANGLNKD